MLPGNEKICSYFEFTLEVQKVLIIKEAYTNIALGAKPNVSVSTKGIRQKLMDNIMCKILQAAVFNYFPSESHLAAIFN